MTKPKSRLGSDPLDGLAAPRQTESPGEKGPGENAIDRLLDKYQKPAEAEETNCQPEPATTPPPAGQDTPTPSAARADPPAPEAEPVAEEAGDETASVAAPEEPLALETSAEDSPAPLPPTGAEPETDSELELVPAETTADAEQGLPSPPPPPHLYDLVKKHAPAQPNAANLKGVELERTLLKAAENPGQGIGLTLELIPPELELSREAVLFANGALKDCLAQVDRDKKNSVQLLLRLEVSPAGRILWRLMGPVGALPRALDRKSGENGRLRALGVEAARLRGWLWIVAGAESEIRISYQL